LRVFHDRLINEEDREIFINLLKNKFEVFKLEEEQVLNIDRILFGDFLEGIETLEDRSYF
jgi:dynein heavy chain